MSRKWDPKKRERASLMPVTLPEIAELDAKAKHHKGIEKLLRKQGANQAAYEAATLARVYEAGASAMRAALMPADEPAKAEVKPPAVAPVAKPQVTAKA